VPGEGVREDGIENLFDFDDEVCRRFGELISRVAENW
jgi:hypothetical protein